MTNEISKAMDMLYDESAYDKAQAERRRLFFKALGVEDDGRVNLKMTDEEFRDFGKPIVDGKRTSYEGKTCVLIRFEQPAFHDISYTYCFEDDVVYEESFYIGD